MALALTDIIYRRSRVPDETVTNLLPYNFFGKYLPLSLDVEDTFDLRSHVPTDKAPMTPRRVFYLEDINCYLVLDVGDPNMAVLYLLKGDTHEIITSYTYLVETCPEYRAHDEIVDVCVHHVDMRDKITVSFLIINNEMRTVSVASYKLEYSGLGMAEDSTDNPNYQLSLLDLSFFANIVPTGKRDEIALGYEMVTARNLNGSHSWTYPEFKTADLVPLMKSQMFIGELTPKYCNLTIDEKGRFLILIGTRITVWMGPLLSFPVDAQYVVLFDKSGMNRRFILLAPQGNIISFDEYEEHQPYKYSISAWDGKYILCLEDRKSRFLNPKRIAADADTDNPSDSYIYSGDNWGGGEVADRYYPSRQSGASFITNPTNTQVGYPTDWQETSYEEPVLRESIWTVLDICDLLNDFEPEEPTPEPPYAADVVFLVDDSGSMSSHITQLKTNINNFVTTLGNMNITDVRIGVAAYDTNCEAMGSKAGSMWGSNASDITAMVNQLNTGVVPNTDGNRMAWHWSAIKWVCTNYKFRSSVKAKYIVLVTDTDDEEADTAKYGVYSNWYAGPNTSADALLDLQNNNLALYVVGNYVSTFTSITQATQGSYLSMGGTWGATMANDLATQIAEATGVKEESDGPKDWWEYVGKNWEPTVYYNYTPQLDLPEHSLVTVFHDNVAFVTNGAVVRNKLNYLTCWDNYPKYGGEPQDSFYLPGLTPEEEVTRNFVIRNDSYTGTMKKMVLTLIDKPDDVELTIKGWPTTLRPRETAFIEVAATYHPAGGDTAPTRHVDIHFELTYWISHVCACSEAKYEVAEVGTGDGDSSITSKLFFVEDTQIGHYTSGFRKEIPFDPLYTLAFETTTEWKEDDFTEQDSWTNKLYILDKSDLNSESYISVSPTPITAIAGRQIANTQCCWLKARGPVSWITTREYECRVNKKTWWLVNRSNDETIIAHPVLDTATVPTLEGTGFITLEYPEGNIIAPGTAVPVVMYWQPIFNPDGEEMTRKVTQHSLKNCQNDYKETVLNTQPAFFNNIIYEMDSGYIKESYDLKFNHTYIESIHGDGVDISMYPDQPLHKMDVKDLIAKGHIYDTKVYLDVDISDVQSGFEFVRHAGRWAGMKDDADANDLSLPLEAKPSDMFDYVEYISPASGLAIAPQYIDHKFEPNPEYKFNGDTNYPYQLTPFNKEYANPYMGTMFVGNVILQTDTIACACIKDFNVYDDTDSPLVPCDASGNELAGWLLEDFWPIPGNFELSVLRFATENDYIFTKTFYVKNKSTKDIPLSLDYNGTNITGLSIQGVKIISNPTIPPSGIAELEISWRLHYTYQEAKNINMVKEIMYIPRFSVASSI